MFKNAALMILAFISFTVLITVSCFAVDHMDNKMQKQLYQAYLAKGKDYKPRTEHLKPDGSPEYINRLILEESPYLIQHAHNPVNWYAWSPDAFAKAKRENKPIFLSIGYSTCHWCHVMERESFDNKIIASYLNEHFIAIKVDRERRPDIDKIYMTATMLINRSGGWPMSSLLTPEGKPFYAGTYFPPEHFIALLKRSHELWNSERQTLLEMADKISQAVQQLQQNTQAAENVGRERSQLAVINIMNGFDDLQGGFSHAPKFPNEPYLFLLMDEVIRDSGRQNSQDIYDALLLTLNLMAQGGIYDQIGGGFHRYSTDNQWLVPHFEKMLYNQAHLARIYSQFFQLTANPVYSRVATQTLDYVLAEMLSDEQAFFSAGDADSEGEEGKFFVWTPAQINNALDASRARQAIELYGVTPEGNFEQHNILNLPVALTDYAEQHQLSLDELFRRVDHINQLLYQQRSKRIAPAIDKKVVTAWNAMMITAFAQAGTQLKRDEYLRVAQNAAEFIWQKHHFNSSNSSKGIKKHSGLWRVSLGGKPSVAATQEDYAYLIQAYIALYDAMQEAVWLQRAKQLTREMIEYFWDAKEGGFFMSSTEQEVPLFNRPKDLQDGAIPSGSSVALEGLVKLYHRTGDEQYHDRAVALLASVSALVKQAPGSFAYLLSAANQLHDGELGDIQYGAKGHVRIEKQVLSQTDSKIELAIKLSMDKGWHINSRFPNSSELIATAISLDKDSNWKISRSEYPQGELVKLKFNDQPLSVYQNKITIKAELVPKRKAVNKSQRNESRQNTLEVMPIRVDYQSCSNKICLAPAQNLLYLFNNT